MSAQSPYLFKTTALNLALVSTPFEVQTNWRVITGAPSCGKSTLINLLADRDHQTVPECARTYMEGELAKGRTIGEIHAEGTALQRAILNLQLEVESRLPAQAPIFLDGALPGSLAWFRLFGLNPNDIIPLCFHHRYASVFILDPLPLYNDGLRFEDKALSGFLDLWLERDYCDLGYNAVRVPVMPPEDRLAFVLERLAG